MPDEVVDFVVVFAHKWRWWVMEFVLKAEVVVMLAGTFIAVEMMMVSGMEL